MKRNFVFLLFSLSFLGCQKYEMISPPTLSGGPWIFTGYDLSIISSISNSPIRINKNDTICVNSFILQNSSNGEVLMKQDYEATSIDRKFIKGKTMWEFNGTWGMTRFPLDIRDGANNMIYENGDIRATLNSYYNGLQVDNYKNGLTTNYTINNTQDVGYSRTLTLLSPPIVTDLYLSNGMRDKAVTVRVSLYFSR